MEQTNIEQLDRQYYMPVFGTRMPAAFVRGEGVTLFDTAGKPYTDFLAGIAVNALGYSDEGFRAVIRQQADGVLHTCNYFYNEQQALLAQALCEKTGYAKAFFANSGAEANECAIKLAKKYAYQKGSSSANFVSLRNSFHGRTLATLTATGQDRFHQPFLPGTFSFRYIEADQIESANAAIDASTCGVLIEVIQGEGGVKPLSPAYVKALRKLCDENDALLIIDEVQTGMGRTGKFLAQEHYGVRADITTLAKALGNGVPIGACLATQKAAAAFSPGDHGSTFGGNHLACAAGLYVTGKLNEELLEAISETGKYFKYELYSLMGRHSSDIIDVRGAGLMLGIQLSAQYEAHSVMEQLFEKGLIIGTAGGNTLRFVPPYIIGTADIDALIAALDEVFH